MRDRLVLGGLLAVLIVAGGVTWVLLLPDHGSTAEPSRLMVKKGELAPAFTLAGADGAAVSLGQYRGNKNVLLYFSMGHG